MPVFVLPSSCSCVCHLHRFIECQETLCESQRPRKRALKLFVNTTWLLNMCRESRREGYAHTRWGVQVPWEISTSSIRRLCLNPWIPVSDGSLHTPPTCVWFCYRLIMKFISWCKLLSPRQILIITNLRIVALLVTNLVTNLVISLSIEWSKQMYCY